MTDIFVPGQYRDFAFEYKLGWESGTEPKAGCPIRADMYEYKIRREAWWAGRHARLQSLGVKRRLKPLLVGKLAGGR